MITPLLERLAAVHSNHKRIAAATLVIGGLTIVAKLFVALREVAIAWRFGVSEVADAYQLSLTITTWLPLMLAGVMTVVLVPWFVRNRSADRSAFVGELNGSVLLLGAILALLTWLAAPAAAKLLAGAPGIARLTAQMAAQMAPIAFCVVAGSYLASRMQARERYAYSIAEAVPAIVIALFVVAPGGGVGALVLGTLVGYAVQLLLLGTMTEKADAPLGGVRFRHRSAEWRSLYGSLLLMGAGQILITATIPIDQAFAARIGEGAVATLGYANRIVTLITGLATIVVGRALLPVLSEAIANDDHALGRRQVLQWSALLFGLGLAVAAIGWLLAPIGVRLLFERGAFDESATRAVAETLRYGLLQLAPFFGGIALVQWYAAASRFRAMLAITTSALVAKVVLNFLLAPAFAVPGIMLSTTAMYILTASLLYILMASSGGSLSSASNRG